MSWPIANTFLLMITTYWLANLDVSNFRKAWKFSDIFYHLNLKFKNIIDSYGSQGKVVGNTLIAQYAVGLFGEFPVEGQ